MINVYSMGSVIKKIRSSKGLTQSYISNKSKMTQSNYSKFEKDSLEIRAASFILILDTMDISLQEFSFISNNYKLSNKEQILMDFFNTPYQSIEDLTKIQKRCFEYLDRNESSIIKDVTLICKALIIISDKNDFNEARLIVKPIWNRLSVNNEFYLYDLYLINSILYIFNIEEVLQMRDYLGRCYKKYKDYPFVNSIFINTYINISLLLIENQKYYEALKDLDFIYEICKKQKLFFKIAIILIRKGICIQKLNGDGKESIEKGLLWLESFEEEAALKIMKKEIETYLY